MGHFKIFGVVALLLSLVEGCAPPHAGVPGRLSVAAEKSLLAEGKVRAARGQDAVAEQYFVAAWDAGEPSTRVLAELLPLCFRGSRFTSALEYVERALRGETEDPRLVELAALLEVSLGRGKMALGRLRELEARGELSEAFYFHLGHLEREAGEIERARVAFDRFLEKSVGSEHRSEARRLRALLEREGSR